MPFYAYEGGPDTYGPNDISAKQNASLDLAIIPIIQQYLGTWYGYGNGLFNWFTVGAGTYDSQYGTWSTTNDMYNQDTAKTIALRMIQSSPLPLINGGMQLPTTFYGNTGNTSWEYMNLGNSVAYLVNVPYTNGAVFNLSMYYSAYVQNASVSFYINNQLLSNFIFPYTGSTGNVWVSYPNLITLGSGLNVLQLVSNLNYHGPITLVYLKFTMTSQLSSPYYQYPPLTPCPTLSSTFNQPASSAFTIYPQILVMLVIVVLFI